MTRVDKKVPKDSTKSPAGVQNSGNPTVAQASGVPAAIPGTINPKVTDEKKLKFIFDQVIHGNDKAFERRYNLDQKASTIIGFTGVIIGLLGALISLFFEKMPNNCVLVSYFSYCKPLLLLGIIFLTLSIVFCLIAYCINLRTTIPKVDHLLEKYAHDDSKTVVSTMEDFMTALVDPMDVNRSYDDTKTKLINVSQITLGVGLIFVIVFVSGLTII